MKVYEINGGYQKHFVIAESISDAERIFNSKYGYGQAVRIEKISDYVQIQGIDDVEPQSGEDYV